MNKSIFTELEHYGEILEKHFHDMMDVEFTVENGKLYILSARIGKRSKLANLNIVMSMFCEGKMRRGRCHKKDTISADRRFIR